MERTSLAMWPSKLYTLLFGVKCSPRLNCTVRRAAEVERFTTQCSRLKCLEWLHDMGRLPASLVAFTFLQSSFVLLPEQKEMHQAEGHAKVPQSCTVMCKSAVNILVMICSTRNFKIFWLPATESSHELLTMYNAAGRTACCSTHDERLSSHLLYRDCSEECFISW
jgi:hypothetical protein